MKIHITLYEDEKNLEKRIFKYFDSGEGNIYIPKFMGYKLNGLTISYERKLIMDIIPPK